MIKRSEKNPLNRDIKLAAQLPAIQSTPSTINQLMQRHKDHMLPQIITEGFRNWDTFLHSAQQVIRGNEVLNEAPLRTSLGAIMQTMQLGLSFLPTLGEVHYVPFWNKEKGENDINLIVDQKGYAKLIYNSGLVKSLTAHVVYETDEFDILYGSEERIIHRPNWRQKTAHSPRGDDVLLAYAIIKLTTGGETSSFLTKADIDEIRRASKSAYYKDRRTGDLLESPNSPWFRHYGAMAMKSVSKRAMKLVPRMTSSQGKDQLLGIADALDSRDAMGDGVQEIGKVFDNEDGIDFIDGQYETLDERKPEPKPEPLTANGSTAAAKGPPPDSIPSKVEKKPSDDKTASRKTE